MLHSDFPSLTTGGESVLSADTLMGLAWGKQEDDLGILLLPVERPRVGASVQRATERARKTATPLSVADDIHIPPRAPAKETG